MPGDLGPLYHWSPRDRLDSIKRLGLVPGRASSRGPLRDENGAVALGEDGREYRQRSVSFSTDPVTAWAYSHAVWRSLGTFDCWMVVLIPSDEVEALPFWGDRIMEVRVRNRIPKSRLRWVGERSVV